MRKLYELCFPLQRLYEARVFPGGYPTTVFEDRKQLPVAEQEPILAEARSKMRRPGFQYADEVFESVGIKIDAQEKAGNHVPLVITNLVLSSLQDALSPLNTERIGKFLQRSVVGSVFPPEYYRSIAASNADRVKLSNKFYGSERDGQEGEIRRTGNSYVALNKVVPDAKNSSSRVLHISATRGPYQIGSTSTEPEPVQPFLDVSDNIVQFGNKLASPQVHESLNSMNEPINMSFYDIVETLELIIPLIESTEGLNDPYLIGSWIKNIFKKYRENKNHTREEIEALIIITSLLEGNALHHEIEFS